MTIDAAMTICQDIIECGEYEGDPYDSAAVKLLIEAGKRLEKARKERRFDRLALLPGETKD